jgi:hypothetical protein
MNDKERKRILAENTKTIYAKAIKELIIEKLISLNEITSTEDYEDYKAKKEAKKLLKNIFRTLNITEKEIKDQSKNQYE